MGAQIGGSYVPILSTVALRRVSEPDSDMVLLRGDQLRATVYGLTYSETYELSDFLMDKLEITNR